MKAAYTSVRPMNIADKIRNCQRKWARAEPLELSSTGYSCVRLENNLFRPMNSDTFDEFKKGDGDELGGKMHALNSSSALACNFFDYWRHVKDASSLADALSVADVRGLCFEQKFPTGLSGNSPNLDVVFQVSDDSLLAIECKFTEPYSGDIAKKNRLANSYFLHKNGQKKELWGDKELHGCQDVAQQLREEELCYHHLYAAQLLKHMLGLANSKNKQFKRYDKWEILYLWFDSTGKAVEHHRQEIDEFIKAVGNNDGVVGAGGKIRVMTYQKLFEKLSKKLDASHEEYREYLAQRYFPEK